MKHENEMIAMFKKALLNAELYCSNDDSVRNSIVLTMTNLINSVSADSKCKSVLTVLYKNTENKYGKEFFEEAEVFADYFGALLDDNVEKISVVVNGSDTLALMKPCDCYCNMNTFFIGHQQASAFEFGDSEDKDPENAPDYGCGDRQFKAYDVDSDEAKECMAEYNIDEKSYEAIAEQLESMLSFGCCAWCS